MFYKIDCYDSQTRAVNKSTITKNTLEQNIGLTWSTSEIPSAKSLTTPSTGSIEWDFENKCDLNVMFGEEDGVENYLESLLMQDNRLTLIRNHKTLMREDHEAMCDKVKILSGGMAGLEPLHAGFVGQGMLTAAILGEVTSSPSHISILTALRILGKNHDPGVLVIAMNNLADRLNFGIACQLASREGIHVLCLVVGEDCSGLSINKTIGRRGLCGALLLQKIAGAMSEEKKTLYEIHCVLTALKGKCLGTVNVGIIRDGIDVGLGLKGEPGKLVNVNSIPLIVNEALFHLVHPGSYFSLHVVKGDNIAVLVNNLGKLSDFQFSLTLRQILSRLVSLGLNPIRVYSGRFLTIKDTVGFSISILKVGSDIILKWLDANANVLSWPNRVVDTYKECAAASYKKRCLVYTPSTDFSPLLYEVEDEPTDRNLGPRFTIEQAAMVGRALRLITESLSKMEEYLNHIDFDHEYGKKVTKFMKKIREMMNSKVLNLVRPYGLLNDLAEIAATHVGGVTGAVCSVLLCSAAQAFLSSSKHKHVDWQMWQEAARRAKEGLCAYTRVQLGDSTVLDALQPFTDTFTETNTACFSRAVKAAIQGAESTEGVGLSCEPDPGAYTVAVILRLIFTELQIDLLQTESSTYASDISYCDSCLEAMFLEHIQGLNVWFCDSCILELKNKKN